MLCAGAVKKTLSVWFKRTNDIVDCQLQFIPDENNMVANKILRAKSTKDKLKLLPSSIVILNSSIRVYFVK